VVAQGSESRASGAVCSPGPRIGTTIDLTDHVEASEELKIVVPPTLNVVAFRPALAGEGNHGETSTLPKRAQGGRSRSRASWTAAAVHHYRCRCVMKLEHPGSDQPMSLSVSEERLTPLVDSWLAELFSPDRIDHTCQLLASSHAETATTILVKGLKLRWLPHQRL
jgi:hypothetical protein